MSSVIKDPNDEFDTWIKDLVESQQVKNESDNQLVEEEIPLWDFIRIYDSEYRVSTYLDTNNYFRSIKNFKQKILYNLFHVHPWVRDYCRPRLMITLTFDSAHYSQCLAKGGKIIRDFLDNFRKYKYKFDKHRRLEYLWRFEAGTKSGRWHYHLLVNQEYVHWSDIKRFWPYGAMHLSRIKDQDNLAICYALKYMSKSTKKNEKGNHYFLANEHLPKGFRRFGSSKGFCVPPKFKGAWFKKRIRNGKIVGLDKTYSGEIIGPEKESTIKKNSKHEIIGLEKNYGFALLPDHKPDNQMDGRVFEKGHDINKGCPLYYTYVDLVRFKENHQVSILGKKLSFFYESGKSYPIKRCNLRKSIYEKHLLVLAPNYYEITSNAKKGLDFYI
jgi:hypothetical protein